MVRDNPYLDSDHSLQLANGPEKQGLRSQIGALVRTHLGRDSAWVQCQARLEQGGHIRDQHRPYLVTIKVSQVIYIQSHPSLLIYIRSGEAEAKGQQSKGLGIMREALGSPQPPLAATYKVRNSQVQERKDPKWSLRRWTLPTARVTKVGLKVGLPNIKGNKT